MVARPERAVIVERGDALRSTGTKSGEPSCRDARDEIGDRFLRRAVVPGRQRIGLGKNTAARKRRGEDDAQYGENGPPRCRKRKHAEPPPEVTRSTGPNVSRGPGGPRDFVTYLGGQPREGQDWRRHQDGKRSREGSRPILGPLDEPHCQRQSEFDPAFSSFVITASRLKLAGFCRTGNSLKLCSQRAASACIGTWTKARSIIHLS